MVWFPQLVLRQTPEGGNDRRHRLKEVGIAAYTREAHKELEHRFGVAAREIYGMTEIGAALSVPPECGEMSGSGSVGIPMLARTATIRDQNGAPVRVGDTGELWVRGPSMLTEYYRKPAANAESFRDGWFRTGDLCRQDDEGFYYIVGRLKDMVRRNSENIAAREVEEVALQVSFVEDAAVVPVPDSRRGEEVKLYVILKSGRECNVETIDAILRHMRGSLAAFKLPRYVAFATSFPRGPSNKIEKGPLKAAPDLRLGSFDVEERVWR